MRLLLDTCAFLWIMLGSSQASSRARSLFADPANEIYLSAVSSWEIALKFRARKLWLPSPAEEFIPTYRRLHGIQALPLEEEAALHAFRLPPLHRDPFDRMLICQSIMHGMPLLTPDPQITQYPVHTLW